MGGLSSITHGIGKLAGGLVGGALGGLFGNFMNPGVKGMSRAEKLALAQQKAEEAGRRTRLLEGAQRRTRVALGSQGGPRSLLYGGGGFTGTDQVNVQAPLDEVAIPTTPAGAPRRRTSIAARQRGTQLLA